MPDEISLDVINRIPTEFAYRNSILPIDVTNGQLTVSVLDPTDLQIFEDLRMLSGLEIETVLLPISLLKSKVNHYYGTSVEKMIATLSENGDSNTIGEVASIGDLQAMAREPTVVNLVNLIVLQAIHEMASDIHLEPFEGEFKVKYRVDGILHEQSPPPKHLQAAIVSRIKIMAEMDIAERFRPQDGHIRMHIEGRQIDFRVATIPTIFGESVVMRILDKSAILLDVDELGLYGDMKTDFNRILRRTHGIVLVTGPTGSGKTTTLYSALNKIYTPTKKFITIEEPVEYQLTGVNQIQVNTKRGIDFANGLRAIVRQDPDVIMVGEIRDEETAEIAIRSALTGHLVFSTLHTNNAAGAITRLLDMGVDPYLISSSLEAVIAQRLIRIICSSCKKPADLSGDQLVAFESAGLYGVQTYRGEGCSLCRNTGYRGRMGIFEMLLITDPIRDLILTRPSASQIIQAANMKSLRDDGFSKVKAGVTTVEEVLRVSEEEF